MSTDVHNQMISVKDKEVMTKRLAFQKSIEIQKKIKEMQPNAIFKSKIDRSCSPSKVASRDTSFVSMAGQTNFTMRTTTK